MLAAKLPLGGRSRHVSDDPCKYTPLTWCPKSGSEVVPLVRKRCWGQHRLGYDAAGPVARTSTFLPSTCPSHLDGAPAPPEIMPNAEHKAAPFTKSIGKLDAPTPTGPFVDLESRRAARRNPDRVLLLLPHCVLRCEINPRDGTRCV